MELQPTLYNSSHSDLLAQFASLHIACITGDHTIATFTPPLSHLKIHTWWQKRANQVETGSRDILFVMAPDEPRAVTGVVVLSKPGAETGPFRGMVEKLLVSPDWRRKGLGRALMMGLEDVARAQGKTLLMLDTETGSPAESFYPALGYVKFGIIPNFGISPKDGTLKSETFFYKDLRSSNPL
ncbi:MAG: hypothetical protein Q9221_001121 [Calogaya cf. arnoldii]